MSDKTEDDRPKLPFAPCGPGSDCGCEPGPAPGLGRRNFIRLAGLTTAVAATGATGAACAPGAPQQEGAAAEVSPAAREALDDADWPAVKVYGPEFIDRIALPLGGIGTGTVSLTGFGSLRDGGEQTFDAGYTLSPGTTEEFVVVTA